jgi:hypothetical protein
MAKRAKASRKAGKRDEATARYEDFRAQWERKTPHRLQLQHGRGKPADKSFRPGDFPRPHKTKAADFLDDLQWLAAYCGDQRFHDAYFAVQESGAIKDGKWAKDFRTPDPFHKCVSRVARFTFAGWSEREALAWAVATFDLPGRNFAAAVARMRKAVRAAEKAGLFPL